MRIVTAFLLVLLTSLPALSHGYCSRVESADYIISLGSISEMREEVERRYDHALDVSMSRRAAYSTSPLFTWANEAKVSCAQALGYMKRWKLERPVVNEYTIQQCDCFYSRMRAYGG